MNERNNIVNTTAYNIVNTTVYIKSESMYINKGKQLDIKTKNTMIKISFP